MANWSKPSILAGLVAWSFLLIGVSYAVGSAHEKQLVADKNKPLTATSSKSTGASVELSKATKLAQSKQYDQAITLLTPEVNNATLPTEQRIQGMILIAQYAQAKTDPALSVTWYNNANKLSGKPSLQITLGAASASAQLFALKSTGPGGPKGAESYRQSAIEYYTQALALADNPTLKSQIQSQLTALNKAP